MVSPRTVLKNLKSMKQYLLAFSQEKQPAYFEHLIVQAFGHILHLPFYTTDNDDSSVSHRVVWLGSLTNMSKAPPGPDGIAYAYDFYVLIEVTLKQGSGQWRQEFSQCLRHCDDFIKQNNLQAKDVYVILITPKLHVDTYRGIRRSPRDEFNFIALEAVSLEKILETSILAHTIRHLELRRFFSEFPEFLQPSLIKEFLEKLGAGIIDWQKSVLRAEKSCFLGIKSYEVIKKIGRNSVATAEILERLQRHPIVNHYIGIINEKITLQMISDSLNSEKLAFRVGKLLDGEELFYPVPMLDFKNRIERIIKIVENIENKQLMKY